MIESDYPLVSIITPVYNGAKYLPDLITSVQNQDYPNFEHIIIDDGSNDSGATVEVLKGHPHLRWWSHENRGQYASMNEGLDVARGEIICFISADDFMQPGAVSNIVGWLNVNPGYDGVYGTTRYISEAGESLPIKHSVRKSSIRNYPYYAHIQHCSLYLYKNTLIQKKLIFNPEVRYVGDYDWIIRLIKTGLRIGFIDQELSTIRRHSDQISSINSLLMKKEQFRIARLHGYGGPDFFFHINLLRLLNLADRSHAEFQKGGVKQVCQYLISWTNEKVISPFNKLWNRKKFSK